MVGTWRHEEDAMTMTSAPTSRAIFNPLDLSGRTILVTGASSGIGRETAICLSRLGARLFITGRNQERLEETHNQLEGTGHQLEAFDLKATDQIGEWFKHVVERIGPLGGLVHSAGVGPTTPLRTLRLSQIEDTFTLNVTAGLMLARAFRNKGAFLPNSTIVYISAARALAGEPGASVYAASKGAIIAMIRSLALELVKERIRVNCVVPGFVRGEMIDRYANDLAPEKLAAFEASCPLGFGDPVDVAHAIAYLIAETGKWITGTALVVDGGYTAT
jgi:NAD(P)-dependent dehydrogenase (short-subunit alcohol dehydrogenase family)